MVPERTEIEAVRDASRRMVRALGFMRPNLAGTDLSPSAVHAIVEIGRQEAISPNQLAGLLGLDKSTISRLFGRLVQKGLVRETGSASDGRSKELRLTDEGNAVLASINRHADNQVSRALLGMGERDRMTVVGGLQRYATSLEGDLEASRPGIAIVEELPVGAIGRIVEMHARYYAQHWNFGSFFEAKVAQGLSEFAGRLGHPDNGIWVATRGREIIGSAAIDGEDLGPGKAHLRWVIVDATAHGQGIGRELLRKAVHFCDRREIPEIHLWTFEGLDAARALYERAGFELRQSFVGNQWGPEVTEQVLVRTAPLR